eukprot:4136414-Amphidinium_carterae.1
MEHNVLPKVWIGGTLAHDTCNAPTLELMLFKVTREPPNKLDCQSMKSTMGTHKLQDTRSRISAKDSLATSA